MYCVIESWDCDLKQCGEVFVSFIFFLFQTKALSSCMHIGQTSLLIPWQLKNSDIHVMWAI